LWLLRRSMATLVSLVILVTVTFLAVRAVPGDPARVFAGPTATGEAIESVRVNLGLDLPLYEQFWIWIGQALQGDLGTSPRTGLPVAPRVFAAFQASVVLATSGLMLAVLVAVPAGLHASARPGGRFDRAAGIGSSATISMPIFWTGILLVQIFAVNLGVLPATGMHRLSSVVLPSLTVALYSWAYIFRITRAQAIDARAAPHTESLMALGISETSIRYKHVARNASASIITVTALLFGYIVGGAAVTETVFAWPGLGLLIVESISGRDYQTVQAAVLVAGGAVLVVHLLADVLVGLADPRTRAR